MAAAENGGEDRQDFARNESAFTVRQRPAQVKEFGLEKRFCSPVCVQDEIVCPMSMLMPKLNPSRFVGRAPGNRSMKFLEEQVEPIRKKIRFFPCRRCRSACVEIARFSVFTRNPVFLCGDPRPFHLTRPYEETNRKSISSRRRFSPEEKSPHPVPRSPLPMTPERDTKARFGLRSISFFCDRRRLCRSSVVLLRGFLARVLGSRGVSCRDIESSPTGRNCEPWKTVSGRPRFGVSVSVPGNMDSMIKPLHGQSEGP
jgi:hypothetical protein